jgi:membrane protein DedA with SNARE-associated domain
MDVPAVSVHKAAGRLRITMFEHYFLALADFVRQHQSWAAPIAGLLAFAESLAFLSLIIPAWSALVAIGALVGAGSLDFAPVWIAGAVGAALGDWISFWLGYRYKERVGHIWPLSRYPHMLRRGVRFFQRWGAVGIAIGRFSGPLRATVPVAAGIFEMPWLIFQIANFTSAFLWAGALLAPGAFGTSFLIGWLRGYGG